MSKRTSQKCGYCGEVWFVLIRAKGKMICRVCVAYYLSQDVGCSICRATGTARLSYKNRGSLCVNCLVAAMSIDEEAIREKITPKQEERSAPSSHGIYEIGSDEWIENNENHQRVLQRWAKNVGRTQ